MSKEISESARHLMANQNNWLSNYTGRRDALIAANVYDPAHERANCGVGLVASVDGTARRDVVEKSIQALKNVWHRGAVDADGKTGDGAGIRLDIPQEFFRAQMSAQVINQPMLKLRSA